MSFSKVSGVICLFLLSACAVPMTGPDATGIERGQGAALAFDTLDPPDGTSARWRLEDSNLPFDFRIDTTSMQISDVLYEHRGVIGLTIPGADLESIAAQLSGQFGDGNGAQILGDTIQIPIVAVTDNRYRARTVSPLFGTAVRFAPHDCFAVLGECRYTKFENDEPIHLVQITTESGGIWFEEARLDPARNNGRNDLQSRTTYSIDQYAWMIDSNRVDYSNGEPEAQITRRIR